MGCCASKEEASGNTEPVAMNQSIMRSVDHASNSFLAPPTATKIEEPARKANMSDKPKIDYSNMKKVKCLFDFTKTDPDSLGLTKGQIVYIENDEDPEWWIAIDPKTEERGAIPKCFVHPYDENLEKEEVDHLDFFFPKIQRSEAEQRLQLSELPGTFLVRPSKRVQDPYTLSVSDQDRHPRHYKINYDPEHGYWIKDKYAFPTLSQLIEFHKTQNDSKVYPLGQPVPKRPPTEAGLGKDIWEVDYSSIQLVCRIGQGNFGEVWSACYRNQRAVAVKTFKGTTMSVDEFAREVEMMKKVKHRRLVQLLGVCSKIMPIFMVLEFMENGNLKNFLKKRKYHIKINVLLSMCCQICEGLEYLESIKVVHRDLAARNVLISGSCECKLADFGLAILQDQEEKEGEEKECTKAIIPVKWSPPESIKDSKFSSKSDVWSYGVVLWEIFSYGADPFPKWTKPEVSEYVKNGKYLGKPRNCPDSIYKIMELCFKFKPEDRPSFKILYPVMQQEEQSAIEKTGLYNEI